MGTLTYLRRYKNIVCPVCNRKQKMMLDRKSEIWFPVSPYCCAIMREADTPEWNNLLDLELAK